MMNYDSRYNLLGIALITFLLLLGLGASALPPVQAWAEENIEYFDPLDDAPLSERQTAAPNVSSIHFDLVGALAIAAGFSVTDAATIQAYSQATDSGPLPEENPVYTFDADPNGYPTAPPITEVMTSTICPSPSTTGPTVTMGSADFDKMECPECFTDRFGPYGTFFHESHLSDDELYAIQRWAWGQSDTLVGKVTFGYSSTAKFDWQGIANVYETTPCFVQEYHEVDTGSIQPGSMEAFGIYLHSLGDYWSHKECIEATTALSLPFAAHVEVEDANDPLWPCRWTDHKFEFGDPDTFPESNRTFTGTLALYDALTAFSLESENAVYLPIPLDVANNHLYNTMYEFVHVTSAVRPGRRREIADSLREWALQTRSENPAYWRQRQYLPLSLQTSGTLSRE